MNVTSAAVPVAPFAKREARRGVRIALMAAIAGWGFLSAAYLAELPLELAAQNLKLAGKPAPYLDSTPYMAFDVTWFLLLFAALIAIWVLFALWIGVAYPRLVTLRGESPTVPVSVAGAIAWIPIVNLVVPFIALRSVARGPDPQRLQVSRWVTGWWLFWALAMVGLIWLLTSNFYLPEGPASSIIQDYVSIPWAVAGIGVGICGSRSLQLIARIEPAESPQARLAEVTASIWPAWMSFGFFAALMLIPFGVSIAMFALSAGASADASNYRRAVVCGVDTSGANCYRDLQMRITSVDVTHGRSGETDTVDFVDSSGSQEVAARPGGLDSALLRTGAMGGARLWHGKCTDLLVGGEDFPTNDNPLYNQNEYRSIGVFTLVIGFLYLAPVGFAFLRRRRPRQERSRPAQHSGASPSYSSTAELLQGVAGQPVLVKPKSPMTLLTTLIGGLVAFAFVDLVSFGDSRVLQVVMGVGFGALFVGIMGWQAMYRLQGGLFADDSTFGEVRQLGRRRSFPRSSAGRIELRRLVSPASRAHPIVAIFFDRAGHYLFRVGAAAYGIDAIERFGQFLSVPVQGGDEPPDISLHELQAEAPGAFNWVTRHPRALGVVIALVLIAAIVPIVILTAGPTHR